MQAIEADPAINAVYSIGGGNRAVLAAFEAAQRLVRVFVAHDLDADNRALLIARKIGLVLHHDLRTDARSAFRAIMAHPVRGGIAPSALSSVEIVTPYNMPSAG
ncbi:ABC-type sugar transport system substrate-binding protein [Rhizobium sp. BK538]|nr:ABC-type sugar transport system substrate-binding protein [Rhizobium sp. BK538]TCM75012.1 hypothetical protein EV291_11692 [Rhizobium sp. BK068]